MAGPANVLNDDPDLGLLAGDMSLAAQAKVPPARSQPVRLPGILPQLDGPMGRTTMRDRFALAAGPPAVVQTCSGLRGRRIGTADRLVGGPLGHCRRARDRQPCGWPHGRAGTRAARRFRGNTPAVHDRVAALSLV
jgi:hypothetical protein